MPSPEPIKVGEYVALDLTENNRNVGWATLDENGERVYRRADPPVDLGWGVCRHGFGLQGFGDGYMAESVARARADALNAGRPATEVPNR